MGVHGLWELLAPVGRRVSVETLAGKRLAIDASIWMIQFMKAMRDEKGEMVRNAHLLGFFRRICKLLFLRTKPVFVFDGGTPALKRRTVIARRRQRENAQAKVRKTAEKLLLNHLKAMKLQELAKELENKKQKKKPDALDHNILSDRSEMKESSWERNDEVPRSSNQEKLDKMLAASIMAEENETLTNDLLASLGTTCFEEDENEYDDEQMVLPSMHGEVDQDAFTSLPPSIQRELTQQQNHKSDAKGKKVLSDPTSSAGNNSKRKDVISRSAYQENLDEMLAASIAAEEQGSLNKLKSTSASAYQDGEDQDVELDDEEMIIPDMCHQVDPAVLASLPPSMQLDLLVQMRERLMAENRQKYQKVKKEPSKFSELQIQAYLKTVSFRREIDEVQKSAAGRGIGGVQTSRIASEANRKFIFSSSFTGDKQTLASSQVGRNGDKQLQAPKVQLSNSISNHGNSSQSSAVTGSTPEESARTFDDNIETYVDERGNVRVSRVRAMGMHMTRDLQRNLDLMKEIENEGTNTNMVGNSKSMHTTNGNDIPRNFSSQTEFADTSNEGASVLINLNEGDRQSLIKGDTSIEISFEDNDLDTFGGGDDDLFTRLVVENPIKFPFFDHTRSMKQSAGSSSESDWEEGIIQGKSVDIPNEANVESRPYNKEGHMSDDSEVEWEEEVFVVKDTLSSQVEPVNSISKGSLEEEADLQEAIRRSMEDTRDKKDFDASAEQENLVKNTYEGSRFLNQDKSLDRIEKPDGVGEINDLQSPSSPVIQVNSSSVAYDANTKPCENCELTQGGTEMVNLYQEFLCPDTNASLETKEREISTQQALDTLKEACDLSPSDQCSKENLHTSDALPSEVVIVAWAEDRKIDTEAETPCHVVEITEINVPQLDCSLKEPTNVSKVKQKLENNCNDPFQEKGIGPDKLSTEYNDEVEIEGMEEKLEEEIQLLDQERLNLGNEQKRLERNAESINSEMFAECQELLQMFGLPYIIAPMEAEAQCAYMELANLVDGVVTDDSDVFLFGARSVYKNIFDDRKYVETYFMKDIENELGLSREKLIRMALLLGSDYTEGISGIGIVNAIEVVTAFPEEDGLHKFREWIESPDPSILGSLKAHIGSTAKKRGSKATENDKIGSEDYREDVFSSEQSTSQAQKHKQDEDLTETKQIFMDKHRNVSKNWYIPSSFPSEAVISAYTGPQVDKSTEPFSWGKPDHFVLRRLCLEKFGWESKKSDDLLLPVLKEYNKHETQLRLEAFYSFNEKFAKIRSKRIKKAVKGITGERVPEKSSKGTEEVACPNESNNLENQTRKKKQPSKRSRSEGGQSSSKPSHGSGRGRGGGRGRGRGRGRGKREGIPSIDLPEAETSSTEGNSDYDDGEEINTERLQSPQKTRRSMRLQKAVNYTTNDDIIDKLLGENEKNISKETMEGDGYEEDNKDDVDDFGNPPSPKGNMDYLVAAGGFCPMEETETKEPVDNQGNKSHLEEAQFSEDCLKIGGGFCMDDENEENPCPLSISGPQKASSPKGIEDITENVKGPTSEDSISEAAERMPKKLETSNDNGHVETASFGALRAMPNLIRKRRRL